MQLSISLGSALEENTDCERSKVEKREKVHGNTVTTEPQGIQWELQSWDRPSELTMHLTEGTRA